MNARKRKETRQRVSLNTAYDNGYNAGFNIGHSHGFGLGFRVGNDSFASGFDGTSIVIPTYNQKTYLAECIDSIERYTPEPHEIIVVDNGSEDGTADYLRSLKNRSIRYKISARNLGFAGGVNQGLMMARGTTVLFLNNDTIVTERWLSNLLACLNGRERSGLVGPVTNYISGEQLIATTYGSTEEMHRFAQSYNRSDPAKWATNERLTGFCVLMRKDVFRRIGFLDEGFEIGNCEDDDFGLRCRLLGLDLVIAKDTFIHHVGSTTIRTLGPEQFQEMYARNLAFYSEKWGEAHALLQEMAPHWNESALSVNDLYPSHVTVRGVGPEAYWIEQGVRRPLERSEGIPAVRLSQIELKNWPAGEPISVEEWNAKQAALAAGGQDGAAPMEGELVRTPDGAAHQHRGGRLHRVSTAWALEVWGLNRYGARPLTEALAAGLPAGLPIIAPPVIKADNI